MLYKVGNWLMYDLSGRSSDGELVQIVDILADLYVLKLYTHGYVFPGVTIIQEEFERHAHLLTDEEAMIEKLSREY